MVKHGHTVNGILSPTYMSWKAMKARCTNPNDYRYYRYGGRGITICERWLSSFENFLEDMGERPAGKTLDRINLNKGYFPDNCRWADSYEQAANSSHTHALTYRGQTKPMAVWARELGLSRCLIKDRINKLGWTTAEALETPKGGRRGS